MGEKSAIEWTDASWSPIRARNKATGKVGWHCTHASPGCVNCYSESINKRLGTGLPFKPGHEKEIEIFLDEKMLLAPLRWKRPRKVFVCSMTDLFADFVKDEWIDKVFAVMALAPQHTFQVLTKRSKRMREYCDSLMADGALGLNRLGITALWTGLHGPEGPIPSWPLPNCWLGVSAEDQARADERIPDLLATPAAVRFVSYEPALGPIDFHDVIPDPLSYTFAHGFGGLDWVICGGESGPGARPMSSQWAREARDQCKSAGVAFFFKQWGEWRPAVGAHRSEDPGRFAFGDYEHDRSAMIQTDHYPRQFTKFGARSVMERVGKKAAGRLLDGIEHNAMPRSQNAQP